MIKYLTILLILLITVACDNPFAPRKIDIENSDILGDQTTIEGLFQNFKYAYNFKDTLIYRDLLDDNFKFIYRDYDKQIDQTWDKQMDLVTTSRLFQSAQNLDLVWNDSFLSYGDSLNMEIYRGFYLTIVFSSYDQVNLNGKVNFKIKRNNTQESWKILEWRDESNN